ncbi:hypothetical protein BCR33DRAFT_792788 [Rhizoclosmatium globosum]|uniref:Uncharacterized protein n=1 Tax=Rhizoclosmatium globosum TaxID=329046 RepID=A0A1Y2B588_9FUNG|nr:hypothetical protein BCR33DRAFT_792788 [Rhizoclosmatium globosum]|eukprot:ORY29876.1 hypothetical protein BCR33DRAFT_792788 [Rhizoclosmatium globosum]
MTNQYTIDIYHADLSDYNSCNCHTPPQIIYSLPIAQQTCPTNPFTIVALGFTHLDLSNYHRITIKNEISNFIYNVLKEEVEDIHIYSKAKTPTSYIICNSEAQFRRLLDDPMYCYIPNLRNINIQLRNRATDLSTSKEDLKIPGTWFRPEKHPLCAEDFMPTTKCGVDSIFISNDRVLLLHRSALQAKAMNGVTSQTTNKGPQQHQAGDLLLTESTSATVAMDTRAKTTWKTALTRRPPAALTNLPLRANHEPIIVSSPDDSNEQDEEILDNTNNELLNTPTKLSMDENAEGPILLLKEVTGVEPFNAGHGKTGEAWERVATNVNTEMGLHNDANVKATGKNAFKRFKELLKKFKADEMESLQASGTEEEFEESEQLLSDLQDLIHDLEEQRVKKKAKKSKEEERRETNGAAIREAAVKLMSDKNKTPKKTDNGFGDEENDPPSSSTRAPSTAKTAASLASTLKEMSEAFHESNAKDSNDAVANQELKERELNLQDRKLALEEARLELERKRQEQQDKLMNALLTKILEK